MSKEHGTEIVVIMDRSGSMQKVRHDMESGLNHFVEDQRNLNDSGCKFTLIQFDSQHECVYDGVPIADVPPIALRPRGRTALLDAVGETLSSLLERKPEGKVVVLIVTDGRENASREWTRASVESLVKECEAAKWEIVFLGANVDSFAEAHRIGVSRAKAANYDPTSRSVKSTFETLSGKAASYRMGRARTMDFTAREREGIKAGEGIAGRNRERSCSCHGHMRSMGGTESYVHATDCKPSRRQ